VEKIVYVLMGPVGVASSAVAKSLGNPSVRATVLADLRAAGAKRIQMNAVDPSLGHPFGVTPEEDVQQLSAMISFWVDSAEGSRTTAAIPDAGSSEAHWYGYVVTESEPLPNRTQPVGPDGRVPGFAQLVVLTRPDHLSWGEWRRLWQATHTTVAINTQSTFRFVQNVVFRALSPGAPAYAGVEEENFPAAAATDLHVFFDAVDDEGKLKRHMDAMSASSDRFVDPSAPVSWTTEWIFSDRGSAARL
jgi:hypothetical protein